MVYNKPIVNAPTATPCALTRSCIRNTLVLIFPLFLNRYAPYPTAAAHPMIAKKESYYLLNFSNIFTTNNMNIKAFNSIRKKIVLL